MEFIHVMISLYHSQLDRLSENYSKKTLHFHLQKILMEATQNTQDPLISIRVPHPSQSCYSTAQVVMGRQLRSILSTSTEHQIISPNLVQKNMQKGNEREKGY